MWSMAALFVSGGAMNLGPAVMANAFRAGDHLLTRRR
jgi:hypothetical protein